MWKVVADISNFFDRISIHSLENHLKEIGCDEQYVILIREMLSFWSAGRKSFGVPVGSDASRILSEVVLLQVDASLTNIGIKFIRYVDDFRIFTNSRAEALKAVEILTALLSEEGLALNSRKTEIYKIIQSYERIPVVNTFPGSEHEKIDLDEKVESTRRVRISGRSSLSRFYRQPGQEALNNLRLMTKDSVVGKLELAAPVEIEENIKIVMKYFIYVVQDVDLLERLIEKRITSIFYIADALVKEADRFSEDKRVEIKSYLFNALDWKKCAYPLQLPVMRVAAQVAFKEPKFVQDVVDAHLQQDCMVFYREAISLGYMCLDRVRLRKLAIDVFGNVPEFVRRAIFRAVKLHPEVSDSEKRPLIVNMKQHTDDWFIARI